eukprot:gnl/Spiro4/21967_TR10785_c0_g1_i1.p1 gnl/Spiro4/21967_TR10785_c0_g1~~gnl/Spiro4/21967_TR10785_c0_g1_i1.p1  ORF type:complete len:242 (+),score=58.14 gnl/Spiro4/21967_TR10785_c0_g1_i1:25-726(+)
MDARTPLLLVFFVLVISLPCFCVAHRHHNPHRHHNSHSRRSSESTTKQWCCVKQSGEDLLPGALQKFLETFEGGQTGIQNAILEVEGTELLLNVNVDPSPAERYKLSDIKVTLAQGSGKDGCDPGLYQYPKVGVTVPKDPKLSEEELVKLCQAELGGEGKVSGWNFLNTLADRQASILFKRFLILLRAKILQAKATMAFESLSRSLAEMLPEDLKDLTTKEALDDFLSKLSFS